MSRRASAVAIPQIPQQLQNLGLDRDVERGRRFVGDDERRTARERDGNHRALPQATGELVRIVARAARRIGHADGLEQANGAAPGLRPAGLAMDDDCLGDLVTNREDGAERRHRLLEDEPDPRTAHAPHPGFVERQQVAALKDDLAADDTSGTSEQPHNREGSDRLAAPRLADQAERFPRRDCKADILHGWQQPATDVESCGEPLNTQE